MSEEKKNTDEEEKAPPSWLDQDPFAAAPKKEAPAEDSAAKRAATDDAIKGDKPVASSSATSQPSEETRPEKTEEDKTRVEETKVDKTKVEKTRPKRATNKVPTVDGKESAKKNGRGKRVGGFPLWGWAMLAIAFIGLLAIALDFRNRDRFRLDCSDGVLALQEGRRLPWPIGFETLGDPYKALNLGSAKPCQSQVYDSREEAEAAFIDRVVRRATETLKALPAKSLSETEIQLQQIYRACRFGPHRKRQPEIKRLLADVAYREGRAGLTRAENELRQTLSRLKQAQKYGGDQYEDLDEWIEHLDGLLKAVTPTPGQKAPSLPDFGRTKPKATQKQQQPSPKSHRKPLAPQSREGAGKNAVPDAGPRETDGNGILM